MYDYFKEMERSAPTDVIHLTHEVDLMLADLWVPSQDRSRNYRTCTNIPADLILSGIIPLLDCKIVVTESESYSIGFRVRIFSEYGEVLNLAKEKGIERTVIGVLQIDDPWYDACSIIPLIIEKNSTIINWLAKGWAEKNNRTNEIHRSVGNKRTEYLNQIAFMALGTWYGVQIALLHPVVRNIFNNPARTPVKIASKKLNSKKHRKQAPVKYVKKHIVNQNELQKLIYDKSGSKSYQRKALIWYVIGHWRTYKNGKRVFVQPHWKGALRDTKLPQSREREIILN